METRLLLWTSNRNYEGQLKKKEYELRDNLRGAENGWMNLRTNGVQNPSKELQLL